jgi:2-oxoglutarate dehydrogenase E1 component
VKLQKKISLRYSFTEADLDREFFLGVWRTSEFLSKNQPM